MTTPLWPLEDYSGYEHCLGALPTFYHPNGNIYFTTIAKRNSIYQDFTVLRIVPGDNTPKVVEKYLGGIDAVSQFTLGGALIDKYGALITATACVPKNDPTRTRTGFQNMWGWKPKVDDPYTPFTSTEVDQLRQEIESLKAQNAALIQSVEDLRTVVNGIDTNVLSDTDRKAINWANNARLIPPE